MIKSSLCVICLASLSLAASAIAQTPTQITLEPLSNAQAALLAENEQLRKQIQELKQRIDTAGGLLRATFVAQNQRGQLAAFRTAKPAHYELTSLVPNQDRPIFLPLLKKNQLSIVPDNSGIVAASLDKPLGTEIADQQLVARLDSVWKSQRFIDASPHGALKGMVLHSNRGAIDDFGVVTRSDDKGITLVNWDGYTKTVPVGDVRLKTGYTGDLQEFVRDVPSLDFLSYAVLVIAHKLGHEDGQRGAVNLAIHVETKNMSKQENVSNTFSAGLRMIDHMFHALQGGGQSTASGGQVGFDIRSVASRMTDELYTRFLRLNVPVVEREALQAIITERQYRNSAEFAAVDYLGLVSATHIAYFTVSKATSFGPYHIEVKLLDCNTGRVLWSDGRDRIDPSQRPSFLEPPSRIRLAPLKLVHISLDRDKMEKASKGLPRAEQVEFRRKYNPRDVWYLGSTKSHIAIADLLTSNVEHIPLSMLNKSHCKPVSETRIRNSRELTAAQLATLLMAHVGEIRSVSESGLSAEVYFAGKVPSVGTEVYSVRDESPQPLSVVQIGAPVAKVTSVNGNTCTIAMKEWEFRSLESGQTAPRFKASGHVCFALGDHLGARVVPLNALAGLVGREQPTIEQEIQQSLQGQTHGATVWFPRVNSSEGRDSMVDLEIYMEMGERSGPVLDELSSEFAAKVNKLRGFAPTVSNQEFVVPLVNFEESTRISRRSGKRYTSFRRNIVLVRYDAAMGRATPVFSDGRAFDLR